MSTLVSWSDHMEVKWQPNTWKPWWSGQGNYKAVSFPICFQLLSIVFRVHAFQTAKQYAFGKKFM